jgi:hypothetical protein
LNRAAALYFLVSTLSAADPKTTIAELNARLAMRDQTITQLRSELATARAQTGERIEAARTGLEFQLRDLESKVTAARAATDTAQQLTAARDDQIRQLSQQLNVQTNQSSARLADSTKVQTIADSAVKTAVRVATARHTEDAARLQTTSTLAGSAAERAKEAARLGEANSQSLTDARKQIAALNRTLDAIHAAETKSRRLMVVIACLMILTIAILGTRLRIHRR